MPKYPVVEVINDGTWLSGRIGARPFAIMASSDRSCQDLEIGGQALFELGCHYEQGVNGLFLHPLPKNNRLSWYEKQGLHELLHLAASFPDAEEWIQILSGAGLLQNGESGDLDDFGEFDALDEFTPWLDDLL